MIPLIGNLIHWAVGLAILFFGVLALRSALVLFVAGMRFLFRLGREEEGGTK